MEKEIVHHKFSLFQIEESVSVLNLPHLMKKCFMYINTFDSLDSAKSAQEKLKYKSIIIPSY